MPRKRNIRLLGYGIFVLLLTVVMLYLLQEKFIFLPTKLKSDYTFEFTEVFEELNITTEDGAVLNALHFKQEESKGLILYFHGNSGDLSRWGEIATYFLPYGYEVLIMDYRTYGKSSGKISEEALRADALLFYDKAKELANEDSIIVYGRSLGSHMASYAASENNPQQLILETPFYSLEDLVGERFKYLPLRPLLRYKFPTNRYLNTVSCPITIIHGTEDKIVPIDSAQKLYDSVQDKESRLITVTGGAHNNLVEFTEYANMIKEILWEDE